MAIDPSAVWDFAKEVIGTARPDRGRTLATVTRIGADGTVWVTTGDGGEAPAGSVAAGVSVGDTVTLEWDGSAMGIRGNVTNPAPAGSVIRRAVERTRSVADAAQKVADAVNQHFFADTHGIHVTEATQEEWDESHTGANVLINSIGQLFRDGLNNLLTLTTEGNARALTIWDGLGNAASNVRAVFGEVITLGNAASGTVFTMDSDSLDMLHGQDEMLHFGYGVGASTSGTAVAPYYTIGTRASNSTVGNYSVAEGRGITASGPYSHAEGMTTTASGPYAHSEGYFAVASGTAAHAEGREATANKDYAHAEGWKTTASGMGGHAEGLRTVASGVYAHAQNVGTIAASAYQTAVGKYNVEDASGDYALIVGNGTNDSLRSNALTVDWDGNVAHGVDIPWTNLQLASSVEPYSDGWTPRYRKWGPVVQVLGAVKLKSNQSAGFNVSIGTLPSECRPLVQVATVCQGSGNDTWLCNVSAGGVMNIERYRNGGTSAAATTSTWLPFSITFLTA